MPNLTWFTGFEHGVTSAAGGGIFDEMNINGTGVIEPWTTHKRSGTYSMRITYNSDGTVNARVGQNNANKIIMRFGFRLNTFPSDTCEFMRLLSASGNDMRLYYRSDSGNRLAVRWGGSGSFQNSTNTISTGQWYLLEFRVSYNTNPRTIEWKIDTVSQTQHDSAETASTCTQVSFGSMLTGGAGIGTYIAHYDDIAISKTNADYPLGDGFVKGVRPNGHSNFSNSGKFARQDDTAAGTTGWQLVDDNPMSSTTDYLKQISIGTGSWIEHTFENITDPIVNGVRGIVAFHQTGSAAADGTTKILDGATETVVYSGNMATSGAVNYKTANISPATTWTTDAVNGLVSRMGFSSDVTPNPQWDSYMLEVDVQTVTTSTETEVHSINGLLKKTLTKTHNIDALIKSTSEGAGIRVSDSFNRSVGSGWGTSDIGGDWSHEGWSKVLGTFASEFGSNSGGIDCPVYDKPSLKFTLQNSYPAISGMVASSENPGIYWIVQRSGTDNRSYIDAIDNTGKRVHRVNITNGENNPITTTTSKIFGRDEAPGYEAVRLYYHEDQGRQLTSAKIQNVINNNPRLKVVCCSTKHYNWANIPDGDRNTSIDAVRSQLNTVINNNPNIRFKFTWYHEAGEFDGSGEEAPTGTPHTAAQYRAAAAHIFNRIRSVIPKSKLDIGICMIAETYTQFQGGANSDFITFDPITDGFTPDFYAVDPYNWWGTPQAPGIWRDINDPIKGLPCMRYARDRGKTFDIWETGCRYDPSIPTRRRDWLRNAWEWFIGLSHSDVFMMFQGGPYNWEIFPPEDETFGNPYIRNVMGADSTTSGTTGGEDWEDITINRRPSAVDRIYIADIGGSDRNLKHLYRLDEPQGIVPGQAFTESSVSATKYTFQFQDGQFNAEAIMIDPVLDDICIVTRDMRTDGSFTNQCGVYRLKAGSLTTSSTMTAELIGLVTGNTGQTSFSTGITSADVSTDGLTFIMKNRAEGFLWKKGADIASTIQTNREAPCRFLTRDNLSVVWDNDSSILTINTAGPNEVWGAAQLSATSMGAAETQMVTAMQNQIANRKWDFFAAAGGYTIGTHPYKSIRDPDTDTGIFQFLIDQSIPIAAAIGEFDQVNRIRYRRAWDTPLNASSNIDEGDYYKVSITKTGAVKVDLFVLDTTRWPGLGASDSTLRTTQVSWLNSELTSSTADWKIVVLNHPPHHETSSSYGYTDVSTDLDPIFQSQSVDMVVAGNKRYATIYSPTGAVTRYSNIGFGAIPLELASSDNGVAPTPATVLDSDDGIFGYLLAQFNTTSMFIDLMNSGFGNGTENQVLHSFTKTKSISLPASTNNFSVSSNAGNVVVPDSEDFRIATLNVSGLDLSATVSIKTNMVPTVGNQDAGIVARYKSPTSYYGVKIRFRSDGAVLLNAFYANGNTGTTGDPNYTQIGAQVVVPGLIHAANKYFRMRVFVEGSATTRIRATAWEVGSPEPSTFPLDVTDSNYSERTIPGKVGLRAGYGSTSTAPTGVTFTFENFNAGAAVSHFIDSVLVPGGRKTITHSIDTMIKKVNTRFYNLRANLKKTVSSVHSIDSEIFTPAILQSVVHSIDSLCRIRPTVGHTVDAIVDTNIVQIEHGIESIVAGSVWLVSNLVNVTRTDDFAIDQRRSVLVESAGTGTNHYIYQAVSGITGNTKYVATAYVLFPIELIPGSGNGTKGASIEITEYNSSNTLLATTEEPLNQHFTNGWQQLVHAFTTQATTVKVEYRLKLYDLGQAVFDSVVLAQSDDPYATSYVGGLRGKGYSFVNNFRFQRATRVDNTSLVSISGLGIADNNISILVWGRPNWANTEKSARHHTMVAFTGNGSTNGLFLRTSDTVHEFTWSAYGGHTSTPDVTVNMTDSTDNPNSANDMIFMAVTATAARTITGYAKIGDGDLTTATSGTPYTTFTPGRLSIGNRNGNQPWDGVIEKIYVFDRVLSSDEITSYSEQTVWNNPHDAIMSLDFEDMVAIIRSPSVQVPKAISDSLTMDEEYEPYRVEWSKSVIR